MLNKFEYIPKSQKFSKVPIIMYKVALNLKNEKEVLLNEKLDPPDKVWYWILFFTRKELVRDFTVTLPFYNGSW